MTANALSEWLQTPTTSRTAQGYEAVFDDFVGFAGGARLTDLFTPPDGALNADYYFATPTCDCVLELKQMATYRPLQTLDAYFSERLAQGKLQTVNPIGPGRIEITPESLSLSEWNRFYKRFRPSVGGHLDKAAQQLKATAAFLPPPAQGRRLFGAILLNTGDFGVSTDLLHRLVEWKVRQAWGLGRYSHLDFVTCLSMDMLEEHRHPLHSRHIARDAKDPVLVDAIWTLFDRWVRYGAAAVGAEVHFEPGPVSDEIRAGDRIRGKIQWQP